MSPDESFWERCATFSIEFANTSALKLPVRVFDTESLMDLSERQATYVGWQDPKHLAELTAEDHKEVKRLRELYSL